MTKTEVISNLAVELNATEKAVDEAIVHATMLVQSMIGGRTALGISPVVGVDAQTRAMEAIAALSAARQSMVACHGELAKDHRRMGYGVYADAYDKTIDGERVPTTGERVLRAV